MPDFKTLHVGTEPWCMRIGGDDNTIGTSGHLYLVFILYEETFDIKYCVYVSLIKFRRLHAHLRAKTRLLTSYICNAISIVRVTASITLI